MTGQAPKLNLYNSASTQARKVASVLALLYTIDFGAGPFIYNLLRCWRCYIQFIRPRDHLGAAG